MIFFWQIRKKLVFEFFQKCSKWSFLWNMTSISERALEIIELWGFPSKKIRVLFRKISSKFSTNSVNFLIYFCNIREISWTKLYFSAWNFSLKDETKPELFLFFSGSFSAQILQEMLRKTVYHYSFIFQTFYPWFFFF